MFENGLLARVSFAHKDVRSPYDWQKEKNPKKQEADAQRADPDLHLLAAQLHPRAIALLLLPSLLEALIATAAERFLMRYRFAT